MSVHLQPVGGRGVTLRPTVLEAEPGRRFRWLGRLGIPGIFDGEHTFTITPRGAGVRLDQDERFRGLLVPLLAGSPRKHTLPGFHALNEALKRRVERTPGAE